MASPGSVVIQFLVDAKEAAKDAADLAKNFGKVDKEADNLDATLDGLDRELDAISREAKDLGDDMKKTGVGFDDVGDEAEKTADRVRKAAQDMARGVHQGAGDIDTETGHIRQNMADTGKEAGAEFIGNMAEGIGSGTANVTDVVQGTLGGLTNLAATLGGPVGLAAAGAAAGIGVLFGKVKAESDKAAAEVQEMIDLLWEVGSTTSAIAKQKIWEDWQADLKEDTDLARDLAEATRIAGITAEEMQGAITGDPAAQQAVVDKLKAVGTQIADNVRNGKPLTEEQRNYLGNQGKIHEALKKQGIELEKTAEVQSAIEQLTGNNRRASSEWADEQRRVYNETHKIKQDLDDIPSNIPVNVIVAIKDKNGRPVKLGPGQLMAPTTPAPAVAATASPPVVVNVTAQGIAAPESARQLVALLEGHQVRMGRKPGRARAVAW